jgi:hypothetical protein
LAQAVAELWFRANLYFGAIRITDSKELAIDAILMISGFKEARLQPEISGGKRHNQTQQPIHRGAGPWFSDASSAVNRMVERHLSCGLDDHCGLAASVSCLSNHETVSIDRV